VIRHLCDVFDLDLPDTRPASGAAPGGPSPSSDLPLYPGS
jgi:hypothetical protein